MRNFAIVLICYKRLDGIKRLLSSVEKVDFDERKDITLIFSIDHAEDNENVVEFAQEYSWKKGEKTIRTFEENQGLKKHILGCGDLTEKYEILVVLEDDLYVSPALYHYANGAAEYYEEDRNIAGISLYCFNKNWLNTLYEFCPQKEEYDTYFLKVAQSWGQVWTKEKWKNFKAWYEKNTEFLNSDKIPQPLNLWSSKSSWLKYYDRYCIEENKYFVYPYFALSTNFSDAGTHANISSSDSQVRMQGKQKKFRFAPFNDNAVIYDEFMEREFRKELNSINGSDLTVDIYANKPMKHYKRYVLSTRVIDKKILGSYKLSLKPAELAFKENIEGSDFFLYDTSIDDHNCHVASYQEKLLRFSMGISSYQKSKTMFKFSLLSLVKAIFNKLIK